MEIVFVLLVMGLFNKFLLLFIFCFNCEWLLSQHKFNYDFEPIFEATRLSTSSLESKDYKAYVPEDIALAHDDVAFWLSSPPSKYNYNDIPLMHLSMFFGACTNIEYNNNLKLQFDLFAEQRGSSFGVLTKDYFLIYPKIRIGFLDTFHLKNKEVEFEMSIGDTSNLTQNEGLLINRLDVHFKKMKFRYKHFFYEVNQIGDMSQNPAVGVTEFYSLKLGVNRNKFNLNTAIETYNVSDGKKLKTSKSQRFHTLTGSYNFNQSRVYFEGSTTLSSNYFDTKYFNRSAILLGYDYKVLQNKKFQMTVSNKFRFFEDGFFRNQFTSQIAKYRSVDVRTLNGNYKGVALYPLINNNLGFDQWSVYQDYDREQLMSLVNVVKSRFYFAKKAGVFLDLETNFIRTTTDRKANYVFYNSGLIYDIGEEIFVKLYLTNKVMNLDYEYQTFYQAKLPLVGFTIQRLVGRYDYDKI